MSGKQTIKSLTAKGYSQKKIALTLHIRKSKVSATQKRLKIGKRVASEFWRDVKSTSRQQEISWKEAIHETKTRPYWAKKRAERKGREYKRFKDFWEEWGAKWREAEQAEREHIYDRVYGDEGEFVGGTPR